MEELRTMFSQYMQNKKQFKSKHGEASNRKKEDHSDP